MTSPAHDTAASPALRTGNATLARKWRLGVVGWVSVLLGIVLAVVLADYDPADPFIARVIPGPSQHIFGWPGVTLADLLYRKLGMAAWVPVLLLVGLGWRIEVHKPLAALGKFLPAGIVALAAGAVAMARLWPLTDWPLTNGLGGGVVGDVLYAAIVPRVSSVTGLGADGVSVFVALVAALAIYVAVGAGNGVKTAAARGFWTFNRIRLGRRRKAARQDGADWAEDFSGADPSAPELAGAARGKLKRGVNHYRMVEADLGRSFELPPVDLLAEVTEQRQAEPVDEAASAEKAAQLAAVLADFSVKGSVVAVRPGPVVTLFEFEPAPGVKTSRVTGLAEDIARSMSATSTRVALIPGRKVIGIEIPNETHEIVRLRQLLEQGEFGGDGHELTLALGKDIGGGAVFADLGAMPHLLIAGTTGSGKSVGINTIVLSLLFRLTPNQCRFIMIDPKMLELTAYDAIPHLLSPVVTDPDEAVAALNWVVREMELRYAQMSDVGAKSIGAYNDLAENGTTRPKRRRKPRAQPESAAKSTAEAAEEPAPPPLTPLPHIVVVIDEVADLMVSSGKEVETAVQRIAQMARAAGIHLIMATQRPSADVITGTIKANFPTRISFRVTSKIDSRTVLGESGAEQLLGHGDMLYSLGGGQLTRVHGAFVADAEVEAVADFLRAQGEPDYVDSVISGLGLHRRKAAEQG